jgi:hypothetical protein
MRCVQLWVVSARCVPALQSHNLAHNIAGRQLTSRCMFPLLAVVQALDHAHALQCCAAAGAAGGAQGAALRTGGPSWGSCHGVTHRVSMRWRVLLPSTSTCL